MSEKAFFFFGFDNVTVAILLASIYITFKLFDVDLYIKLDVLFRNSRKGANHVDVISVLDS